jgi:hypothetical protein
MTGDWHRRSKRMRLMVAQDIQGEQRLDTSSGVNAS